jgi:hypothetical protein
VTRRIGSGSSIHRSRIDWTLCRTLSGHAMAAKLRHHGVSIDLLAKAPVHLADRIHATAFDRDQAAVFFTELQYRSGLTPHRLDATKFA